eukprot:24564-Pelagomonas_calceolata.AAC.4
MDLVGKECHQSLGGLLKCPMNPQGLLEIEEGIASEALHNDAMIKSWQCDGAGDQDSRLGMQQYGGNQSVHETSKKQKTKGKALWQCVRDNFHVQSGYTLDTSEYMG